jgi:trehalose 6-phosphate phosphatase
MPSEPANRAAPEGLIEALRPRLAHAGFFLDFDGTLSEIVPRAFEARPVPGAVEAVTRLAEVADVVAVITGRTRGDLLERFPARGLLTVGVYGLEDDVGFSAVERVEGLVSEVERVAATLQGAWVERKGVSLAVHFRQAADPDAAERHLRSALGAIASAAGLSLVEGKRVLELAPAEPSKGAVVERIARGRGLDPVLYGGDDVADLDGFDALDRLASDGVTTVKVAVVSRESPRELSARGDLACDGPRAFVRLLRALT